MRTWRPQEVALVVIATVAVVGILHFAAEFIVPVVAGFLLAYALEPPVRRLSNIGVPRGVAAALVLAAITGTAVVSASWLRDDAAAVVAELPQAARKLRAAIQSGGGVGPLAHVQEAAAELERAATEASGKKGTVSKPPPAPTPVASDLPKQLAAQGAAVVIVVAQLAIVVTLALFILAAGDGFRRKIVRLVGPSLAPRRITVEILNEIDVQVQRYMLVMLVTNVLVGLACWAAYAWLGLARPALWGTVTAVLHFIPYVGGVVATFLVAAAALIETGSLATTAYVVLATLGIVAALGMGFNTWLQGRACRMNAVAVFIIVLLFGWLWGAWGLLLGAPLAAIAKTIADRIEGLKPLGELLGPVSDNGEAAPAAAGEARRA